MIHGFPDHYIRNAVYGTPIPARGLVGGVYLDTTYNESGDSAIRWNHFKLANIELEYSAFLKTYNSINLDYVLGQTYTLFPLFRVGQSAEIGILPVTYYEKDMLTTGLFAINPFGDRIVLTWDDVPTDDDFYAFQLWWDAGGGTIDTLLKTLIGENNREYGTAALASGTYKFRLRYEDLVGNLSANTGDYAEVTTRPVPLQLSGVEASYNQTERKVTISWSQPGAQLASVCGVGVYDNFIAGVGFTMQPCIEKKWRRAFVRLGTTEWESAELAEGTYKFCARAVDENGLESPYTVLTVNLEKQGGDLVQIENPPNRPYFIDAQAQAGGDIDITIKHDQANMTGIRLYVDGVAEDTLAKNTTGIYEFTYTGVDATTYVFTATAYNADCESDLSDEVSETADATAPTGDQTIETTLLI